MYRSDVVGSLLRPAYLKKAREDHEAGRLGDAEFKRLEDRAVDEAVALHTPNRSWRADRRRTAAIRILRAPG